MNEEMDFVELFQRLVEQQKLSPEVAEELLQIILEILARYKIGEQVSDDG